MNNSNIRKLNILFTSFVLNVFLITPIFQSPSLNADDIDRSVNRPLGGGAGLHVNNPANVDYSGRGRGDWHGNRGYNQPQVYNYYNYPYDYGYYDNISPYPYYDYNYYDHYARYPALSYPLSSYLDNTSLYNSSRYRQPTPPQANPNQNYYYYPN
jgi:hypothetical protein